MVEGSTSQEKQAAKMGNSSVYALDYQLHAAKIPGRQDFVTEKYFSVTKSNIE